LASSKPKNIDRGVRIPIEFTPAFARVPAFIEVLLANRATR
jgi:hypothetical protein